MSLEAARAARDRGALALAFARTGSGRARRDPLATGESLLAWMRQAGLFAGGWDADTIASPSEVRILLAEALALRTALLDLLEASAAGRVPPEPVLFAVDRVLGSSVRSTRLEIRDGKLRHVESEAAHDAVGRLAPIARSAAELVTAVDPSRLRRCAAPRCETWFVDTSRGGRRRWCSMKGCGNRQKAARHRRRRASEGRLRG